MSGRFDWKTNEENWEAISSKDQTRRARRRRRWVVAPLMFLGILLIVGLVYIQIEERVEEVEAGRETDVLSSFQLLKGAASQQDSELFRTFLSGRDLEWAMTQQTLFSRQLLDDRIPFGLHLVSSEFDVIEVNLESSLQSAVVIVEENYVVASGDELTETIQLRTNNVFRQGDRWLWSPPTDEYWGDSFDKEETGQFLTLFFPERDASISRRLLQDLDKLVGLWCQDHTWMNCPQDLYLQVRLSRHPSSFLDLADQFYRNGFLADRLLYTGRAYEMELPTPSLVGIPVDDAGYQALLRGYGANILGALSVKFLESNCCENEVMEQALFRSNLAEYGLFPWPVFQVTSLSRSMTDPDQKINFLCTNGYRVPSNVLQVDLHENSWEEVLSDRYIDEIKGTPLGNGFFMLEKSEEGALTRVRITLRDSGKELIIFDEIMTIEENAQLSWRIRDHEPRLVIEIPDLIQGVSAYYNYDLRECDANHCEPEIHNLLNTPTWSPDGSQLLVRQYGMIWRQKGFEASPVANGVAPFWIDDETYGYLGQIGDKQIIIVDQQDGGEPIVAITTQDLWPAITKDKPQQLIIGYVSVIPSDIDKWIILAFGISADGGTGEAFIFSVDRQTEEILLVNRSNKLHSFNLSPGGKWLATTAYDDAVMNWRMTIHEFSTDSSRDLLIQNNYLAGLPPTIEWSPMGDQILLTGQGTASIIEPETQNQFPIIPPVPGCTQAVWAID